MVSSSFLSSLRASPFLGILRGIEAKHIRPLTLAADESGLEFLEVTMNTPDAAKRIQQLVMECRPMSILVGAGTVLTLEELRLALEAGAQFIVSPHCDSDLITECVRRDIPCLPGALTPTEIQKAYALGATCVKVFPAKALGGPAYFKELRGPFHDIPLLACGGVGAQNVTQYFESGADAVAFGTSIFRKEWLNQGAWDKVVEAIRDLRSASGR
ncbi:MAG TPA: bifunctional 4-hydroxy-2-oxoglutarate aldolase/2-dehydro-3-deoxy-phosphogluconate aldolase [Fibrobacteraceae bacterium]|nr:bifunctional 4-hydroxy-2-oxoglutarate aldolase/2-dehydro-3-deoxy-phosphogluconate aldolase [Fibrobacteraceae bacterium]